MPDSQGNYLGDHATVLPNNTEAMLHFSDQFIQMEQQRRAKKEQEQKLEQDRHGRIQKLVNDNIYNPDYLKNDATNPLIKKSMSDWAAKVESDYNQYGETAAYDTVNKGVVDIASGAQRIAQTNQNLIQSTAQHKALHPDFESEKAINAMATSAWYKTDEKGNSVHKSLAEINPTEDYLGNLNKEHKDDYYPEALADTSMDNYIDKMPKTNVGLEAKYNSDGSLSAPGRKGEAPSFGSVPVLKDGKYGIETRSENYRLPGSSSDYFFDGKPVKILPKNVFDDVYNRNDSVRASINRKVKEILAQPVKDANGQEVQYGPDSEYAKMLTQKLTFDAMDAKMKNRFGIETIDESDKMKREHRKDNLENARFNLSEHNSQRQDEKMNHLLNVKEDVKIRNLYDEIKLQSDSVAPGADGKALTTLSASSQGVLMDLVSKLPNADNIIKTDIYLHTNPDNTIDLRDKSTKKRITGITFEDVNLGKTNPDKEARQGVLGKAKELGKKIISGIKGNSTTNKEKLSW